MLQRLVYAGTHNPSFDQASQALRHLVGLQVSTKQVERLTQRIGVERCGERDARVGEYVAMSLAKRKETPQGVIAPDLAVVQMDGGRLQILDRSQVKSRAQPGGVAAAAADHWREDKVGVLLRMTSEVSQVDPCPTIPLHFLDPLRIMKLTREIKGASGTTEEAVEPGPAASDPIAGAAESSYTAPVLEQRDVVATRAEVHSFGEILAQAAWERGFYGGQRRAFVADGSNGNWGVWERHFSNFTPIVDFIHALTYVFAAAMAGRSFAVGWAAYQEWIAQVWKGRIERVIAALTRRQAELGVSADDEAQTSPRQRVADALGYLENQKERMRYAAYRQQGLPITSSHVESTIKRINQRVKGTEKFWSEEGAEAILQLRADTLSETEPLEAFRQRRQAAASGQRRYSRSA